MLNFHKFFSSLATAPADIVKEMSRGYLLSRAIHTAAEIGVADHVQDDPVSAFELAQVTQTDPEFLERLLRFLSGHGIFSEVNTGLFCATPLSEVLREDHPESIRAVLRVVDNAWWNASGNMLHSIKAGESAFDSTHHVGFFEYLSNNTEQQNRYDAGMANNSKRSDRMIAEAYDFSQFNHIVDIGGGRGGLLAEILKRHATISATLFDQPQVIERPTSLIQENLLERCQLVGGNFFVDALPAADAYLIKGVLHDFSDADCIKILKNCRNMMQSKSKILILERPITADNHPHPNKTMDMLMMILLKGKERTLSSWNLLLEKTGLKLNQIIPASSDFTIMEIVIA